MDRRRFLRTTVLAVGIGLAGCTGDGAEPTDTTTATTTASTTEPTTATTAPTTTEPTTATTDATTTTTDPTTTTTEEIEADRTVTVAPDGKLRFDPASFEVEVGATVRWEWDGSGHNVSPSSQPDDADWPGDDDSLYSSGHTHTYTFDVSGTYEYHCVPHQTAGMTGSFRVE